MPIYEAAVSDADILIHFGAVKRLDVLLLLCKRIVIPKFIFDVEMKRHMGIHQSYITNFIANHTAFERFDREIDRVTNNVAKSKMKEYHDLIGPGEEECTGYATALGIPIILSDNYTEHQYMTDEFIVLTYFNILTICAHHDVLRMADAEGIYNDINSSMNHPSGITFSVRYDRSLQAFAKHGWNEPLQISGY